MDTTYPERSSDDWRRRVEEESGGPEAYAEALVTRTLEGLDIAPMYGPESRGEDEPAARRSGGWTVASEVAHPDPRVANERALHELESGATGLTVELAPDGGAPRGVRASSASELDALLSGVWLDAVPIAFGTHAEGAALMASIEALAAERGVDPGALQVHLGLDPLAVLARDGCLPGDAGDARREVAMVARHAIERGGGGRALAVDAGPWHDAGGDLVLELALAAAGFAEMLRWLEAEDVPLDAAAGQFAWRFEVGRDVFAEVAKLRAARALHARVLGAAGVRETAPLAIHAFTSERGATSGDAWTNMLRATLAVAAAAVGGADLVTARAFDAPRRGSGEAREASAIGRRFARNVQLVLSAESGLGRVGDAARGSAYVEARTDALARAAWARFAEIERAGGLTAALTSGHVAELLARSAERLGEAVADGARPLVGATHYPPPPDAPAPPVAPLEGLAALDAVRAERLAARGSIAIGSIDAIEHAVRAARSGVTFAEVGGALVRGAATRVAPLPRVHEEDLAAKEVSA